MHLHRGLPQTSPLTQSHVLTLLNLDIDTFILCLDIDTLTLADAIEKAKVFSMEAEAWPTRLSSRAAATFEPHACPGVPTTSSVGSRGICEDLMGSLAP